MSLMNEFEFEMKLPVGPWALEESWALEARSRWENLSVEERTATLEAASSRRASPEAASSRRGRADGEEERPPYEVIDGVALFSLDGPMTKKPTCMSMFFGGQSTSELRNAMRQANRDPKVRSMLLCIDSPGGQVSGTGDLAGDIARINLQKPVVAYAEDLCASAAYWVASQCHALFVNPTAMVGSIGIYMVVEDSSRMYENQGVKVIPIKAGNFKAAGVEGTQITEAQITEWRRNVKAINARFVEGVAKGRKLSLEDAHRLADGRVHVGEEAVKLGLADRVCSIDDALGYARSAVPTTERPRFGLVATEDAPAIATFTASASETITINCDMSTELTPSSDPVAEAAEPIGSRPLSPGDFTGKEDMQQMSLKDRFLALVKGLPDDLAAEDEGSEPVATAPPVALAPNRDVEDLKAQVATLQSVVASLNSANSDLTKRLDATASEKRLQANLGRIEAEVRQFKMTPAEAEGWKKLASDNPDAFEAALPALAARPMLPQFSTPVIKGSDIVGSDDAMGRFNTRVNALIKGGMKSTDAVSQVAREDPALAAEVREAQLKAEGIYQNGQEV